MGAGATSVPEAAAHKTFRTLDTVPHVLTLARIIAADRERVVWPAQVPNPNWPRPGTPGTGQQAFGDALLKAHPFALIPSVVSAHSWNVVFDPGAAGGCYGEVAQEALALDARLHPTTGAGA